jgi:hypothetical protein
MDRSLTLFPTTLSQTLRFQYLLTCFNSYATQVRTWPYFDYKIGKYQVTLASLMQNHVFILLCTLVRKDNVYNKFYKTTTYMQVNVTKW